MIRAEAGRVGHQSQHGLIALVSRDGREDFVDTRSCYFLGRSGIGSPTASW